MDHPIENMMRTTMESIKDMVDVNTVIGDPVETGNGDLIIPISRVSFGFVAGGGEYEKNANQTLTPPPTQNHPFAGGAGAGVTVCPMGFLVVSSEGVRMLPAHYNTAVERLIELAPQVLTEVRKWCGCKTGKEDPRCEKDDLVMTDSQTQPDQMRVKDEL